MSEPTTNNEIKQLLFALFLEDPDAGEQLAREYGLWEWLYENVAHRVHMQACRKDPDLFLEYIMTDPETGVEIVQQLFHREWQMFISKYKRTLIAAPRGHGKSIQVVGRIIWELGNNHDLRVKIIGSSDEKAREVLGLVSELIKSQRVRDVFPDLIVDSERGDRKEAFFVKRRIAQRDPSVQASGVLSAGAGGRADLLVCDDVVDIKNAITNPAMRDQVTRAIKETWFSLLASKGRIVWICTPYHIADCSHDLKNTPKSKRGDLWHVWWTPAVRNETMLDDDGQPILEPLRDDADKIVMDPITGYAKMRPVQRTIYLWPDKWGEEELEDKRIEVGERVFARQYLLNAMSDEERTFPERGLRKSFEYELMDIGDEIPDDWPTFGGVDLASALGKRAAWTVIWTLAKNPADKRIYLKAMWREKADFNSIVAAIRDQWDRHKWRFAYVENNGFQRAVIDALDQDHKCIPVRGFTTTASGKFDERVGLPGLAVAFERGLFAIPAAKFDKDTGMLPNDDDSPLATFMGELRSHPGGEWSDTVMAFWFAYRAAIEGASDFEASYLAAIAGEQAPDGRIDKKTDTPIVDRTTPYRAKCIKCFTVWEGRGQAGLCPICGSNGIIT